MIGILLHLFMNPGAWIGIGAIALIAVGIYFTLGPVILFKVASDIRTWFAIAMVLLVLAFAHSEKRADDLEKKGETAAAQHTSDTDAAKTTDLRVKQKTTRQAQTSRLQGVIDHAQPSQAQDDVLDAIDSDRTGAHASPAPAGGVRKQPDGAIVP